MSLIDFFIVLLALAGSFFGFVSVVGIHRLPDLYSRAHAVSKSDTLASVLTLSAVVLTFREVYPVVMTVFLLLFMFLTNPTATHAITRSAFHQEIEPWKKREKEVEE